MQINDSRIKLPIVIGFSLLTFVAGFLNQINTGFECLSELMLILTGNVIFWMLSFNFIYRQSKKEMNKRWFITNLKWSLIFSLINQVFTFLLLFSGLYLIFGDLIPFDFVSHILTNHLIVIWLGYWVLLIMMALLDSGATQDSVTIESVMVKQNGTTHSIQLENIQWISADNNCAWIITAESKFAIYKSLKSLEAELPDNFVRIHKSTILNTKFATQFHTLKSGDMNVALNTGHELRVSRNYKQGFLSLMPQVI